MSNVIRSHYPDLKIDPVGSIVRTLVDNLDRGYFELANQNYADLLATLQSQGSQTKHIKYARRELIGLKTDEEPSDSRTNRAVDRYLAGLPKPATSAATPKGGLEIAMGH
ncbi:MAG TPA: hypothetical protein VJI97_00075 [Candidatus Nanoarchaeia archaeon]|nr:hypothetical protein [Candidatus Nanoarchaeia archaeon]